MASLRIAAEVDQARIERQMKRLKLTVEPKGVQRMLVAAARGYARWSREKYLSGPGGKGSKTLRKRTGRLHNSVEARTVSGGRAAVVAGGKDVYWAPPHEYGHDGRVTVKTYYRRQIKSMRLAQVKAHQRLFRAEAIRYLARGVENGGLYARQEIEAEYEEMLK